MNIEEYYKQTEYHKINAPYKRWREDLHTEEMKPKNKKWNSFKEDEFSKKEFEYLFKNDWYWVEKLDGTNIRIYLNIKDDNIEMTIKGRTNRSDIPKDLIMWIENWFETNYNLIKETFNKNVILYGEGVGEKIQKNGNLFGKQHFKLFDIKIDNLFLKLEDVQKIAQNLNLEYPELFFVGSMEEAIALVKTKPKSTFGNFIIEGFIGKPLFDLKDRQDNRIITKIKVKDFT